MASLRADFVKYTKQQQIIYSDIPTNFDLSPNSGDLAVVINEDAVKQSLENLILTIVKERAYNPNLGCTIQFRAFELANEIETALIKSAISDCINQYEPRAKIQDVLVDFLDDHSYRVAIYFKVINITNLQTLSIIIKKTR